MNRYEFTVTLSGIGANERDAWLHALESFGSGFEECPDDFTVEPFDEED